MSSVRSILDVARLSRKRFDSIDDYREMQRRIAELSLLELAQRGIDLGVCRVLEIGSGAGGYSDVLAQHSADLTASDVTRHPGLDRDIELHILDATETFPFPDKTFDFVYCSSVIEHLHDPTVLLPESTRVLRPGGKILLSFPPFYSLFLVGGHQFKPWHLLGRAVALEAHRRRNGFSLASYEQAGLYPLSIRDVERLIEKSPLNRLDSWTRLSPVNFMRLPRPLSDLLSWHSCWLLERPFDDGA